MLVCAVLASAVLHASWNALAHAARDRLAEFVLFGLTATFAGLLLAAFAATPLRASWRYIALSVVLHTIYNLLLMLSYRLGHFGQTYPLARGTSPLLVTFGAVLFAGEVPPPLRLVGILLICLGLCALMWSAGRQARHDLPAIFASVATGVVIATYTMVDGLGVRASGTAVGYTGWLFFLEGLAMPVLAVVLRGRRLPAQLRPYVFEGLLGGLLSVMAYGLVLWAQVRGQLAPIAALRETSIVFGALIAAVRFREPFGASRTVAAILVALGAVFIAT